MAQYDSLPFSTLKGQTLTHISKDADNTTLTLHTSEGQTYLLYHVDDCCESVYLEDITGDLSDILNTPILLAQESTNRYEDPPDSEYPPESYTWSYYILSTIKGSVTLRWYGHSNGYYSEEVTLTLLGQDEEDE